MSKIMEVAGVLSIFCYILGFFTEIELKTVMQSIPTIFILALFIDNYFST